MSVDRRRDANALALAVALIAFLASGCNNNNDPMSPSGGGGGGGGGTSSTFVGTMAGPTIGGKLTLVVPTANPAPANGERAARATIVATGTFTPAGGAAVGLAGSYDTGTKALLATGGGYSFTGTYFSGVLRGSWTRTPAAAAGTFVVVLANSATSVKVYCGTFTSTSGGASGIFNFAVQGSTIDGLAYTSSGTEIRLQGTLAGTSVTLINPLNPGPFLATGTINAAANTASGTYDDSAGNSGNWSGVGS
jgi:hypothetical protein